MSWAQRQGGTASTGLRNQLMHAALRVLLGLALSAQWANWPMHRKGMPSLHLSLQAAPPHSQLGCHCWAWAGSTYKRASSPKDTAEQGQP